MKKAPILPKLQMSREVLDIIDPIKIFNHLKTLMGHGEILSLSVLRKLHSVAILDDIKPSRKAKPLAVLSYGDVVVATCLDFVESTGITVESFGDARLAILVTKQEVDDIDRLDIIVELDRAVSHLH